MNTGVFVFTCVFLSQTETAPHLIERAIRAVGIPDAPGVVAYKVRGVMRDTLRGTERGPYPFEIVDARDGRFRTEYMLTDNSERVRQVAGSDGETLWSTRNGVLVPFSPAELAAGKDSEYLSEVSTLRSLSDRLRFRLETIPGAEVDGVACEGVRVRSDGHPDVDLYFDARTHLLRKKEYAKLCADGKRYNRIDRTAEYKKFNGVYIPTKNDTLLGETVASTHMVVESVEFVPIEKVAHLFKKPE